MKLRDEILRGLVLLVIVAVVARVVWGLLGPLLPTLLVLVLVGGLLLWVLRGPHAHG